MPTNTNRPACVIMLNAFDIDMTMRIALMIEGQEDVTWEDWVALADACERSGVEALFRSDHYFPLGNDLDRGVLDAWGTVCALAAVTLRYGTG